MSMDGKWAGLLLVLFALSTGVGCAVPQPRGEGKYERVVEPTTGAAYHLYLPVDYVRNNGVHPTRRGSKWPVVMTFHGMRPYDDAKPQEREWEQEADTYGYVVCAPELWTSDSFMEYPLTREHSYVKRDRRNVIAIMDHVFRTTNADPRNVLSTSWSCGGYLAHYFANRYPERFSCVATRLSNFSADLMIEETVPLYRDRTAVALFIGDGDLPACKVESEEAVAWYMARGFRVVRGKMIDDMGHRRIPQTAAAFFAEQMGIQPLHPANAAETVAQVQMTEYYPPRELIAKMSPRGGPVQPPVMLAQKDPETPPTAAPRTAPMPPRHRANGYTPTTAGTSYPATRTPLYSGRPTEPTVLASATPVSAGDSARVADGNWLEPPMATARGANRETPSRNSPAARPTRLEPSDVSNRSESSGGSPVASTTRPPRRDFEPKDAGPRAYPRPDARTRTANAKPATPVERPATATPKTVTAAPIPRTKARAVNVRLSGPLIGTAPHYLAYSVDLAPTEMEGADFLWMDNGIWIGDESRGVKILESPGRHTISVLIITKDNREYRGSANVEVLARGPGGANARPLSASAG